MTEETKKKPKTKDPSALKASENGTDPMDYATRLMNAQSRTEPLSARLGKVEQGMMGQGYDMDTIRNCVGALTNAQ